MQRPDALFPAESSRIEIEDYLTRRLVSALGEISDVSPSIDIEAFRKTLSTKTFDRPEELAALIDWTLDSMTRGLVQMTHPRYFGLFNPAPSFPAECADRIVSAFNPQVCVWSHAPIAAEIEAHVINQVGRRAGLADDCGGHFTSGGSEANNTALICALTRHNDQFGTSGARVFGGQPRIYVSRESHLAWLKIARQTGIGRNAVCLVDTDGTGRMDSRALSTAIDDDIGAGMVPVMIAATAGTTNAGMIDPLTACADVAMQHRLWFHVDAAWGGALIASERYRSELDGIGAADSITIDAHKWFATPMGAGMFLTPNRAVLQQAFRVATDYMPSSDSSVDSYLSSMQWSRRFIGLKLFLSLATVGWEGYSAHIERGIKLIDYLVGRLRSIGWTAANSSRMAVACLLPPAGSQPVADIVARIVDSGEHWVSMTKLEGEAVLRVCITNGKTSTNDIDALASKLVEAATL